MESVYVPVERNKSTNLRETAAKYITNGRYNPMRSVVIAEEYKQKREKENIKKREIRKHNASVFEHNTMIYDNVVDLFKAKIRY